MIGSEIALGSILLMLVLVYSGMHIAVALTLLFYVGVGLLRDNFDVVGNILVLAFEDSISDYLFGVVPLFVLMGLLVSVAGIRRDMFQVVAQMFRKISGGLGIATVAANAVFAAITGISIASAAVFTRVAVPEMIKHGYAPKFSVGVVAGSSVLGMLIPPSLLFIVYGILTELSVGTLFIAGVIPGLLLAAAYCIGIVMMMRFAPGYIGKLSQVPELPDLLTSGEILSKITPIILLVTLVLGGHLWRHFHADRGGRCRGDGRLDQTAAVLDRVLERAGPDGTYHSVDLHPDYRGKPLFTHVGGVRHAILAWHSGGRGEHRAQRHGVVVALGDDRVGNDPGFCVDHVVDAADCSAGPDQ